MLPKLQYVYYAKGIYPRFRHPKTGELGLPKDTESAEFYKRYSELLTRVKSDSPVIDRQSWSWIIKQYMASVEFAALRGPTQKDYAATLDLLDRELGKQPFRFTTRKMIKYVRDSYAKTPRKAHKVKQMASRLYSWADENEYVPEGLNPAKGIKEIKRRKMMIEPWADSEIELVLSTAPVHLLTPVMLALYTGQRRKDIAEMKWSQYDGSTIRVRQSKTGELMEIPCHVNLRKHLDAIKPDVGGVIAWSAGGRPYTPDALSTELYRHVHTLPMPHNRSFHGFRFTVAGNLNDAGCTPAQCSAILGHKTYQMAMEYMERRIASVRAIETQETG